MNNIRIKVIVTLVSIFLVFLIIFLYFLDKSMKWNNAKIISCVFVSFWALFIPQMITYYFFKIRNSGMEYSISLGYEIGMRGFLGFILAPYYGIKFYFVDLNEVRYNGEWFL